MMHANGRRNHTRKSVPYQEGTGCLRLLAKGYTSTKIAEELGIGQSTVMDFRRKLHKKMKVNRVGELVFKATEPHLI